MNDEPLEIKPEKRTYSFTPETSQTMPDDVKEAALKRIEAMTQEQRDTLVYLPVSGWEIERILLCDQAKYRFRVGGEVRASARVAELRLIREGLREVQDILGRDADRNGDALILLEELKKRTREQLRKVVQKEVGEVSVADIAEEFGYTRANIRKHWHNFVAGNPKRERRAIKVGQGKAWKITLDDATEFRAYLHSKRRRRKGEKTA
jgi:hypothetical protein